MQFCTLVIAHKLIEVFMEIAGFFDLHVNFPRPLIVSDEYEDVKSVSYSLSTILHPQPMETYHAYLCRHGSVVGSCFHHCPGSGYRDGIA